MLGEVGDRRRLRAGLRRVSIETMKRPSVKIAHSQLTPTIASATRARRGSSAPGSLERLVHHVGVGPLRVGRA